MAEWFEKSIRMFSFTDANVRYVFVGMVLLGIIGGVLGSFTYLRKRALIGDALAHAALPGIGLAFLVTGVKSIGVLLVGAYVAGVLGVLSIIAIRKYSKVKEDAALALVLTVFFGIGIVLLTYIQKSGMGSQAGLDKFLFGQSAAMIPSEVLLIGTIAVILTLATLIFRKELTLLCFDPVYASSLGFNAIILDVLLMGMTVAVVVIGLQAVGVVLMSALLIIPPVTARMWTYRIGYMILISAIVGAISGAGGSYLSFMAARMPSGPLTVLSATGIFFISLMIAPERGLLTKLIRRRKMVRHTERDNSLRNVAEYIDEMKIDTRAEFRIKDIGKFASWSEEEAAARLDRLARSSFAEKTITDKYRLTDEGCKRSGELLRRHRLWELYLMNQANIAADHVHRDADDNEHFLTPEIEKQLIELVGERAELLISPHPVTRRSCDHG